MNIKIQHITPDDWEEIAKIYKQGIATGFATFETEIPTWEKWDESHIQSCRVAAWNMGQIVGWAALSPVSSRCVYGGVAEVSVYINTSYSKKGIGSKLLEALIDQSEKAGFWTLQAGIFPQNIASIKLHEKMGFRIIGYREKIGKRNNIWYDNVILERRSKIIGID